MNALTATALLGIGAAALSGCGPRITNANIEVVNRELDAAESTGKGSVTTKEVESILGQPKRVETYTLELQTQKKELDGVRYYYEQDGQTIELHFLDNRLISRLPNLEPKQQPTETSKP